MKRSELFGFAATVLLASLVIVFSVASVPKVTEAYTDEKNILRRGFYKMGGRYVRYTMGA